MLIAGLSASLIASCAPGTEDAGTEEPAAKPAGIKTAGASAQDEDEGSTGASGPQHTIPVDRLRLPEMETLPDDRELAAGQIKPGGGGGVIARPPSE